MSGFLKAISPLPSFLFLFCPRCGRRCPFFATPPSLPTLFLISFSSSEHQTSNTERTQNRKPAGCLVLSDYFTHPSLVMHLIFFQGGGEGRSERGKETALVRSSFLFSLFTIPCSLFTLYPFLFFLLRS